MCKGAAMRRGPLRNGIASCPGPYSGAIVALATSLGGAGRGRPHRGLRIYVPDLVSKMFTAQSLAWLRARTTVHSTRATRTRSSTKKPHRKPTYAVFTARRRLRHRGPRRARAPQVAEPFARRPSTKGPPSFTSRRRREGAAGYPRHGARDGSPPQRYSNVSCVARIGNST